ncbi:C2orf42 [Pimephales promelas]|nr:C2orf42 [Pimephales promelas]
MANRKARYSRSRASVSPGKRPCRVCGITMDGPLVNSGIPLATQTVVSPVTQTSGNLSGKLRDKRKTPAFLSNLGKATLRGIRKCPQCGVYNGTRGLSCKNKACGTIFRDGDHETGRLKKGVSEVVRVVTDSEGGRAGGPQVFSVRQRGRGSEQRGFVELVLTDTAITTADGTLLTRVNLGRCFMPSCQENESESTVEGSHQQVSQTSKSPCTHVKQAMECQTQATPLPLKSSVLEALVASPQVKEELWRLATETPGPLVQRVSKGTLIVKCQPGEAHPLGLLHLTVGLSSGKEKTEGVAPFRCACSAPNAKGDLEARSGSHPNVKERENSHEHSLPEHCLHFYACVCAFTSDEKLATEFSAFLNYNMNGLQDSSDATASGISQQHIEPSISHRSKRLKFMESSVGSSQPVDETHVSLGFQQWLASVTERIHQTMHFQFDGKPEPLVFHIPQSFFNALQQRLSLGSKKRRLPNYTTTFVRDDALPLGSFSKYTWHITNLMQVKRIFDTPELPLELTQSFVKNSDGSYSLYRSRETHPDPGSDTSHHSRTNKPLAIRPLEQRTFLRVGTCAAEQTEPVPFVIEWIPDILPHSQVGELRIKFEYGHQLGSKPEHCNSSPGTARTEQTAADSIPQQ